LFGCFVMISNVSMIDTKTINIAFISFRQEIYYQ
jgi:hypothetical protein